MAAASVFEAAKSASMIPVGSASLGRGVTGRGVIQDYEVIDRIGAIEPLYELEDQMTQQGREFMNRFQLKREDVLANPSFVEKVPVSTGLSSTYILGFTLNMSW